VRIAAGDEISLVAPRDEQLQEIYSAEQTLNARHIPQVRAKGVTGFKSCCFSGPGCMLLTVMPSGTRSRAKPGFSLLTCCLRDPITAATPQTKKPPTPPTQKPQPPPPPPPSPPPPPPPPPPPIQRAYGSALQDSDVDKSIALRPLGAAACAATTAAAHIDADVMSKIAERAFE